MRKDSIDILWLAFITIAATILILAIAMGLVALFNPEETHQGEVQELSSGSCITIEYQNGDEQRYCMVDNE